MSTSQIHGHAPLPGEQTKCGDWRGTDNAGRDVLTRLIYGTRISLTVGLVAVALYITVGTVVGAVAGYYGGWVDGVIQREIEGAVGFARRRPRKAAHGAVAHQP